MVDQFIEKWETSIATVMKTNISWSWWSTNINFEKGFRACNMVFEKMLEIYIETISQEMITSLNNHIAPGTIIQSTIWVADMSVLLRGYLQFATKIECLFELGPIILQALSPFETIKVRQCEMIAFSSCAKYTKSIVNCLPKELLSVIWKELKNMQDTVITISEKERQMMVEDIIETISRRTPIGTLVPTRRMP